MLTDAAQCAFVVHSDHRSSFRDFLFHYRVSPAVDELVVFSHVDQSSFRDTRAFVVMAIDCSKSGSMAWFGPSGPFGWLMASVVRGRLGVCVFATSMAASETRRAVLHQVSDAGLRVVVLRSPQRSPPPWPSPLPPQPSSLLCERAGGCEVGVGTAGVGCASGTCTTEKDSEGVRMRGAASEAVPVATDGGDWLVVAQAVVGAAAAAASDAAAATTAVGATAATVCSAAGVTAAGAADQSRTGETAAVVYCCAIVLPRHVLCVFAATVVLVGMKDSGKPELFSSFLRDFDGYAWRRPEAVSMVRMATLCLWCAVCSAEVPSTAVAACEDRGFDLSLPRLARLSAPGSAGWVLDTPDLASVDTGLDGAAAFGTQLLRHVREAAAFCRGRCVVLCVWSGEHLANALVDGDLPLPWLAALRAARADVASPYGRGGALRAAPRCCRDDSWTCCGCRCECAAALLHVITSADVVPRSSRDAVSRIFVRETSVTGEQPFWMDCSVPLRDVVVKAASAVREPVVMVDRGLKATRAHAASMAALLHNDTGYRLSLVAASVSPPVGDDRWVRLPGTVDARSTVVVQLCSRDNGWFCSVRRCWVDANGTVVYKVELPAAEHDVLVSLDWTLVSWLPTSPTWKLTPRLFPVAAAVADVFHVDVVDSKVCAFDVMGALRVSVIVT
jgi:hypothetical protein